MSAPIYRDPVYDGATDPTVIWDPANHAWTMFYTQRRATVAGPGVSWVHGSRIGVAVSADGGLSWEYRGTVEGLDSGGNTHWAPEVIRHPDGSYRMYLTVIEGIHAQWDGPERHIVEYRSPDLASWERHRTLELSSDFVIDAAVALCGDGNYRLWYKDEANGSTTWSAVSRDLESWVVEGVAVGAPPHEGPNVFVLGDWYWMLTDEWHGLAVHRSTDGVSWSRQEADGGIILAAPGRDPLDHSNGQHADVIVGPNEARVFYFTHPLLDARGNPERASAIHVARLTVVNGTLVCDRDVSPVPLFEDAR